MIGVRFKNAYLKRSETLMKKLRVSKVNIFENASFSESMGENCRKTIENMQKPFSIVLVRTIGKHARKRIILFNEKYIRCKQEKATAYEKTLVWRNLFCYVLERMKIKTFVNAFVSTDENGEF